MSSPSAIIVDTNSAETPLYEALLQRFGDTVVHRARLDLGDIRLEANDGALVIERKTWQDWSASICDGRYKEQKARFIGSKAEKDRLVYLIEGKLVGFDGYTRGMSNKSLNAAILKTQLRDGIPVVHSQNSLCSGQILGYMFEQFKARLLDPDASVAALGTAGSCKSRKRKNLDEPTALFRAMLAVIPGMSDAKAAFVAEKYPSFTTLFEVEEQILSKLPCGEKRCLGGSLAKRILKLSLA
jgi:ERCC4-type nuclease